MNMKRPVIIEVPIQAIDKTGPATSSAGRNVDELGRKVDSLTERVNNYNRRKIAITAELEDRVSSRMKRIMTGVRGFAGRTFRATISIIDHATAPIRKIMSMATSLTGMLVGGAGLYGGIMAPIGMADQRETSLIGFETMLKDKAKAESLIKEIETFASATPLNTSQVTRQAQSFLTQKWAPEELIPTLTRIGNLSSAMGSGEMGMASITRALTQIKSKGKLSSEEMLQLSEAMVPAWDYLAKAKGVDIPKVREMVEDGDITADEAIQAILKGMDEFDGMMEKMSNRTFKGIVSNIRDAFDISILQRWGKGLQSGAIDGMATLRDWIDKNEEGLKRVGDALEMAGKSLSHGLIDKLKELGDNVNKITSSAAWADADTFRGKLDVLWSQAIQPWAVDVSARLGEGLGSGLRGGILFLMGVDADEAFGDGFSIGKSFAEGFIDGFQPEEVGDKIMRRIGEGLGKTLPGGEEAGVGDYLVSALFAGAFLKFGGKGLLRGGGGILNKMKPLIMGGGGAAGAAGAASAASKGLSYDIFKGAGPRLTKGPNGLITLADDASKISKAGQLAAGASRGFGLLGDALWILGKKAIGLQAFLGLIEIMTAEKGQRGRTTSGVLGGLAGTLGGAAAGTLIAPGIGTILGALAGGFGGDAAARWAHGRSSNRPRKTPQQMADEAVANHVVQPVEYMGLKPLEDTTMKVSQRIHSTIREAGVRSGASWAQVPSQFESSVWKHLIKDSQRTSQAMMRNLRPVMSLVGSGKKSPNGATAKENLDALSKGTTTMYSMLNPGGYAKGGVVTKPTLAWIGEGGDNESIIPHNSSARSKQLWRNAGKAIGAFDGNGGTSINVGGTTINVTVNASGADAQGVLSALQSIMPKLADDVANHIADNIDIAFQNSARQSVVYGGGY